MPFRSRVPHQEGPPAILEGPLPAAGLRRNARYRRSLAAADVAGAALALLIAIPLLGDDRVKPLLLVALPLVVLVAKVIGLYDRDQDLVHHTTLDEAPALFQTTTLFTLVVWLAHNFVVSGSFSSSQVIALWGLLFLAMLCGRAAARWLVRHSSEPERCVVLGDVDASARIERRLAECGSVNAVVLGRAALQAEDRENRDGGLLGDLESLPSILTERRIERVIIAPTSAEADDLLDAIRVVKALGVKVSVLPRLFEAIGSSVRFDHIDGITLLGIPTYGLTNSSRLLKRGMDVVGAGFGLLLLAPLYGAIAFLVKLSSQGPVFFRQARIGRHGQEFQMVKFRTMVQGADERKAELLELNETEGLFKIADDPRLTAIGTVLRRFSLDELPQLWNVLRGQMSLVGPRPLVPEEDCRVGGWQRRRLEVTPGMTGIWQVLGSARIPLGEMVKIDYLYAANWSLWLDLKILLRTALFVFGRRGL